MRTTIDLPDELMKKVKIEAIKQGLSLKEFFTNTLEKELTKKKKVNSTPWKDLAGSGDVSGIGADDSGFDSI